MKWLIISDTHGFYSELYKIIEKEKDIKNVIFLGDGINDIRKAKLDFPDHNFEIVAGNCDVANGLLPMSVIKADKYKILITHGDGFDVKRSKLGLRRAAINMGVDIVLYGHTHKQYYEYMDGLYIFCPGSVKPDVSTGFSASYGIMDFSEGYPNIYNCEMY